MSYAKKSTFTEYKFAFLLLLSSKLNFSKQNRNKTLNLIVLNEQTTSDLQLHASSSNQLFIHNLQFVLISMESKILGYFANKAVKE